MACDDARVLASARLDAATTPEEDALVAHHLVRCAGCRDWEAAITASKARFRIGVAEPVEGPGSTDPVGEILAAIRREQALRRPSVVPMGRLALLLVAMAELLGAIPGLLGGSSPEVHLAREHAASEIALAFGFAWAAHRPLAAQGIGVVSTVLSVLIVATGSFDVVDGTVPLALERGHLLAVVGTVLVWLVTRSGPAEWLAGRHGRHGRLLGARTADR